MSRLVFIVVAVSCLVGYISAEPKAEPNAAPSYFYPVEHRTDLKALQEQAALHGYNLQIVRRDTESDTESEDDEVEYDPVSSISLSSILWALLPSPIVAIKAVIGKIFSLIVKVMKFLLPVNLVLLGMSLVLGFCVFTPYCTLIIEEPIASKIRGFKEYIPYVDEIEYYVYEAVDKVHALQS